MPGPAADEGTATAGHRSREAPMRWQDLKRSGNVEDRRGLRVPGGPIGGGIGVLVIIVVALISGADPRQLLQNLGQSSGAAAPSTATPAADDTMRQFVAAI